MAEANIKNISIFANSFYPLSLPGIKRNKGTDSFLCNHSLGISFDDVTIKTE